MGNEVRLIGKQGEWIWVSSVGHGVLSSRLSAVRGEYLAAHGHE